MRAKTVVGVVVAGAVSVLPFLGLLAGRANAQAREVVIGVLDRLPRWSER